MRHFVFETIWGKQIIVSSDSLENAFKILDTEYNKLAKLKYIGEIHNPLN